MTSNSGLNGTEIVVEDADDDTKCTCLAGVVTHYVLLLTKTVYSAHVLQQIIPVVMFF